MDRLPRDVACERMHMDIVQLLEEYVPPTPINGLLNADTPALLLSNLLSSSAKPKAKKRIRTNNLSLTQRKDALSEASMHIPSVCSSSKTVKDSSSHLCLNSGSHVQTNMGQMSPVSDGTTVNFFPVTATGESNIAAPAYLDCKTSPKHISPLSNGQNSVPPNGTIHTSTPIKQRPSLPTSPTHMAAMMAAHQLYSHQYPTPPWQPHGTGSAGSPQQHIYLPETPESPGQWSSSSDCSASPLQPKAVLFI